MQPELVSGAARIRAAYLDAGLFVTVFGAIARLNEVLLKQV
ncbi:hypothetical protein [Chroococcidiopsis sp. CCNUC1]|nr:hypothetical protein [Chroococcidiopsis sp. CCNUC1]